MANKRRYDGDEAWSRLQNWTKGQKSAERLAVCLLCADGFESIDPSQPLGGRDGLKDLVCAKQDLRWIGAVSFSRHKKALSSIKKKFRDDFKGVKKNKADAFIFITNQELTQTQRKELVIEAGEVKTEIYHLERITGLINSPKCYGIRLEFLDIGLTKAEQLAFFAVFAECIKTTEKIVDFFKKHKSIIPSKELKSFENELERIVGRNDYFSGSIGGLFTLGTSPIGKLHNIPLEKIREFSDILKGIVGYDSDFVNFAKFRTGTAPIDRLHIPLDDLKKFNNELDMVLKKLEKIHKLKPKTKSGND